MIKNNSQLVNTLIIIVGAGLSFYGITAVGEYKYMKIIGIVILMFGLYRATQQFVVSEEKRKDENDKNEE